jgi:hypothetical protein
MSGYVSHLGGGGYQPDSGGNREIRISYTPGPRYMYNRRDQGFNKPRTVVGEVHRWDPPKNAAPMETTIEMCCPECGHPMFLPYDPNKVIETDEDGLTIKAILSCNKYYVSRDKEGRALKRYHCNWKGVVRNSVVHHPNCPCANMRMAPSINICSCGGLLSEDEKQMAIKASQEW